MVVGVLAIDVSVMILCLALIVYCELKRLEAGKKLAITGLALTIAVITYLTTLASPVGYSCITISNSTNSSGTIITNSTEICRAVIEYNPYANILLLPIAVSIIYLIYLTITLMTTRLRIIEY